jgi:hypothetical protein
VWFTYRSHKNGIADCSSPSFTLFFSEPLHYQFSRNSYLLQKFNVLIRLLCQNSRQEVKRINLLVMKPVLDVFASSEGALNVKS